MCHCVCVAVCVCMVGVNSVCNLDCCVCEGACVACVGNCKFVSLYQCMMCVSALSLCICVCVRALRLDAEKKPFICKKCLKKKC